MTSEAIAAGVAYCSLSGFGCGTGARDWRMRSSCTFFIGSTPRSGSLVEPTRRCLARLRASRRDDRGEVGGPGPQQRQEALAFEPPQFCLEVVEVHAPQDLEELILLKPQRAAFREQLEDLLPKTAIYGPSLLGPERPIDNLDREGVERVLDGLTGPRGRERERGAERLRDPPDLFVRDGPSVGQVRLVHEDIHRHVPRNLKGGRDPFVERVQAVLPGDVADGHERLRAVKIGLPHEILEPPLAHDVEDRQVQLDLDVRAVRDGKLDLTHPRPDRVQVRLLILAEDEAADEGCLPDAALPQQSHLSLHATDGGHRRTRPLRIREANISRFVVAIRRGPRSSILSTGRRRDYHESFGRRSTS